MIASTDELLTDGKRRFLGFRHLQVLLLFLMLTFCFAFRVNISMAIVAMTDDADENSFDWSIKEQSLVLSAFTWGYVVTQTPGGELVARLGRKVLLCNALITNSLISFISPIGAYYGGWRLLFAFRVVQGLGQGILMPSMHNLIGKWAPLDEKSRIGALIICGCQAGVALQMILSGYLVNYFGWPSIFYTNGIMGTALLIVFIIFGSDSPQSSRWISERERLYIQSSLGQIGGHKSFDWSIKEQSLVLSAFTWGYVVTQTPGGELVARLGRKVLLCNALITNSLISFISPIGAYYGGWRLLFAFRVVQGLGQGILMPSMHNLIGKWAPLDEKSRIGALIICGCQAGVALQMILSGYLVNYFGWPSIFYTNGIMGTALLIVFIIFGSDSPQSSRWISERERLYIQSSLGQIGGHKKLKTPWKRMWTSVPFIALIVANCAQSWGLWTFMTLIPSYLSSVQGVSIKANGVMSAIPYIAIVLLSLPFGYFADLSIKKKWCSLTVTRKICNTFGFFGPALALIGLSYASAGDVTSAVALLTLVVALNAGHFTGFMLGHIDMAPNFAGTMSGITNGISNVFSIFAPIAAGWILKDETDANEWRKVFYLSSGIYIGCNIFYVIFGSSERQDWNEPETSDADSIKKEEAEKA